MVSHSSGLPRLITLFFVAAAVVFLGTTHILVLHAQTTDPFAQQWADKRVELERIAFLRRSWQISDAEYRDRTNQVNVQLRDLGAQIAKLPPGQQAQIRQQQDSVFTVVIIPLREQWQQQTKDREARIRADIATDAKTAADLQANRTVLNEKLQRKEISQTDFSSRDQTLQQQLVAMQNKWASVDPGWGNLFSGSWQRLMPASLADLRKKDAEAQTRASSPPQNTNSKSNDDDVRTAVGALLEIQHNVFLRDKQAITAAEEQKRDAPLHAQADAIQAKYPGNAAKDFVTRVSGLVDSGIAVRKSQWEQEARAGVPGNPASATAPAAANNATNNGPSTPPVTPPTAPTPTSTPRSTSNAPKTYVKEMPDVNRVLRSYPGKDPDSISRQLGVYTWLQDFIYTMNGMQGRGNEDRLASEEQRLIREYTDARTVLMLSPNNADPYSFNRRFRADVLQQFFAPQSAVYRANYNPRDLNVPPVTSTQTGIEAGIEAGILSRLASALYVLVLPALVLIAAAVGFVLYRHFATKSRQSPVYHQVKAASIPAQAAPQRQTPRKAAVTAAPPGDFRQQLFAEQKEKYQARYNDAADEITAASMELTQLAPVVENIRNNLRLLSKAAQTRVQTLIQSRCGGTARLIGNALLLMPLWRLFGRLKLIGKIIFVAVLYYFVVQPAMVYVAAGQYSVLGVMYGIVAAILFFVDRHKQLKAPLNILKSNAGSFKDWAVNYVYENQTPHLFNGSPAYHTIGISSGSANVENRSFYAGGDRPKVQPGAFLLTIENVAMYAVDRKGTFELIFAVSDNALMNHHGALLTEALNEQKSFVDNTLPPLADYSRPAWQSRKASEEIPRIEKLIKNVESLETVWRNTYTSDEVFEFLIRRIDLFNMGDSATPPGLLLYGYPGNGKTHLVKKIAESVSARLEQVNGATLTSAEQVKAVWDKNRGNKDAVILFVKNAEQIFPKPGSENQSGGTKEATMAWVQEWEKFEASQSRMWVVMTAQSDQELHPDILAQFSDSKVEISAPDAAGREMILQFACRENKVDGGVPPWVARLTSGASVQELQSIVKAVKRQSSPNLPDDKHWQNAIKAVRGPGGGFDPRAKWADLILAEDTLKRLKTLCESLRSLDSLQKQGIEAPRGALFYGPPGTGKTQIARTLANESGLAFLDAAPADLKAGYIGQSGQKVQALFDKARGKAPCILFIDEFDSSAAARGSKYADQFTDEIVNGLLAAMDGVKKSGRPVFVVAATNYLERIDPAILSRFMYKIEIPNPDPAQRTRLFQVFLGRQQRVDFNVDEIAAEMSQKAGNISGRDIDNLVRAASQTAMERAFADGTPDQIVLTRKDLLAQLSTQLKEVSDEDLEKIWSQIVLKPDIKKSILSKIRMFNSGDKATPRGLLLYGPPGTGKTEIARRIADSTNSVFESLSIASLKAGYTGQSGQLVKQLWDKARSRGRAVIFVDECEGVFGRRGGLNTDSFSEEIIQEFLAQWDGVGSKGQIWVIGATNRRDMLDEAIVSRFGAAWEIGLPDVAERVQILRLEMRKMERDTEIPEFVGALTTGLAGRGLATVARDVCTMAAEQKTDIQPEMWREVLARYTKASSDAVDAGAHWDSLVLPDNTLRKLKTVCDSMKNAEILAKQGFEPLRGALLYGPPGTGKTQIARTLANESGVAFIGAGPADLKAGYLGQSVQKVNELFQRARDKAPSILFIDEIEACCADRNGPNADQYTNEIVTEFLRQMDGVKKVDRYTFVLAATNHPNLVDAAILSRFEEKIEIRNPGPAEREQLLKVFLRKYRVDFDVDAMAAELSSAVGDVGGRDIQSLVRRASQVAVQRALEEKRPDQVILTRQDLLTQIDRAMHA